MASAAGSIVSASMPDPADVLVLASGRNGLDSVIWLFSLMIDQMRLADIHAKFFKLRQ